MTRRLSIALAGCLCALVVMTGAASADVSLSLEVDPPAVQVGDQVNVTVTMDGAGLNAPNPELPDIPNLEVLGTSGGPSIQIINGQTTVTHRTGLILRATTPGRVTIGPATVQIKGKRYQSNTVTLEIADQGKAVVPDAAPATQAGQPVFIDVEIKPETAYPGQEVIVTFYFYLREGVGLERAELAGDPVFKGALFHRLSGGSSFSFTSTNVGDTRYKVSPLTRYAVYPIASGELQIEPLTMNVSVPDRRRSSDPFGLDAFFGRAVRKQLQSPARSITVKPLPTAGRPAGFDNNVGEFTMRAALDKHSVRAGEGVTLSVTIEGRGNAEALTPPDLHLPAGLRGFKEASRDDSVPSFDTMKARRIFETVVVPEKEGQYTLGPVTLPVFNPARDAYEVLSAGPLNLSVAPGDMASGPPRTVSKETVALEGRDIRTLKPDAVKLEEWNDTPVSTRLAWLLIALSPVAFAVRVWRVRREETLAGNVLLARRLRAGKEARRRLSLADKASGGPAPAFGAELSTALFGFVADQLGVEAPSLTAASARDRLSGRGVADELLTEFTALLGTCDAMRFGGFDPAKADRKTLLDRAGRWLDAAAKKLGKGAA